MNLSTPICIDYMYRYLLIISYFKDDIVVIAQYQGEAKVECNNSDIVRVTGYNWLYVVYGNFAQYNITTKHRHTEDKLAICEHLDKDLLRVRSLVNTK